MSATDLPDVRAVLAVALSRCDFLHPITEGAALGLAEAARALLATPPCTCYPDPSDHEDPCEWALAEWQCAVAFRFGAEEGFVTPCTPEAPIHEPTTCGWRI